MRERNVMIQATPEAASWVAEHFWSIIQFLVLFAGIVGAWFSIRGDVQQLKLDRVDDCKRLEHVESHITDTARHRDPERDERRIQGIEHTLDKILSQLERLGRDNRV